MSFINADKMLCGVTTLCKLKLGKNRNKTSALCHSGASTLQGRAVRRDVSRYSTDICTGSEDTETESRPPTVAKDAVRSCRVRVTSSAIDVQLPLTDGETVNTSIYYISVECV